MDYMEPFNSLFNMNKLQLEPEGDLIVRRLTDMEGMYQKENEAEGNPKIYEYYNVRLPEEPGHLQHCVTVIFPGKIGNEYHMTKGHYHEVEDTAEIYFTIQGEGKLVMQTKDGDCKVLDMGEGIISYIPPYWSHRTINTGENPLVFVGVYPGNAGHDYGNIEEQGMKKLVIEENGETKVINNPDY